MLAGVLGIEKDTSAYGQVSDTTWRGLLGSVCFALLFQAATVVTFSCLRRTKYGAQWLCPKRAVCPDQTPPDLRTDTLFGWIPQLWNMVSAHSRTHTLQIPTVCSHTYSS